MLHRRLGRSKLKWRAQEHQVLRDWRQSTLATRHVLVAVSGGIDSVVLLQLLQRLKPVLKIELSVVYVHHGLVGTKAQTRYRERAQKFVQKLAQNLDLPFYTNEVTSRPSVRDRRSKAATASEAALRDFRFAQIAKVVAKIRKRDQVQPVVALAHHRDDLLETQMLRLIRGTGVEGLRAMSFYSVESERLRPLLNLSKSEIHAYAKELKLDWLGDPSNENTDPLRNWLRQKWLPSLEKKSPGSQSSLARSFLQIVESLTNESLHTTTQKETGFSRADFLALSLAGKKTTVARYLRSIGIFAYTQGQIEEICRRLDNAKSAYTFEILKHVWVIDTLRIKAVKIK